MKMNELQIPGSSPEEAAYLKKVQETMSAVPGIDWTRKVKSRVLWTDGHSPIQCNSASEVIRHAKVAREQKNFFICVVENISQEYIGALGAAWNIHPDFFFMHGTNPSEQELWTAFNKTSLKDHNKWNHLAGVYKYHGIEPAPGEILNSLPNLFPRHCFKKDSESVQSNTQISYCRVSKYLYLFLVDAPVTLTNRYLERRPRSSPSLRFPLPGANRNGVLLPELLLAQHDYNLFNSLQQSILQHSPHFRILFDLHDNHFHSIAIPYQPLLFLMASSLWDTNAIYLDRNIKQLSFEEIRNPTFEINNTLHDLREDLAKLKAGLTETIAWTNKDLTTWYNDQPFFKENQSLRRQTPIVTLQRILNDATQLEAFLMQTFQLFMSSISIQDSQASIEQTKRATMLTQLAFIYVPLSFVTGVFGMNIKELNGSGLHIWVFFVFLAIAMCLTMTVFVGLNYYQKEGERRKRRADSIA